MKKKQKINVIFVLDKSGSMDIVRETTIKGFNDYVDTLKKDKKNDYSFTLVLFDTIVEKRYKNKPLKDVKKLTNETYVPDGWTALYDAVCMTANEAKKDKKTAKEQFLMVILTDGQENSSKEYNQKNLQEIVAELKKKKTWQFVFLGSNQDAWATASNWGLNRSSVVTYTSTPTGVKNVFYQVACSTVSYSSSLSASSSASSSSTVDANKFKFFTDQQQQQIKKTK